MKQSFTVLLLILTLPRIQSRRSEPKGASITLHAKWQGTPFTHEAAEFLADDDPAHFWNFVKAWAVETVPSEETGACWNALIKTAGELLPSQMTKVLKVSLALRQYSAKLETFRQLASSSAPAASTSACCWAVVNGQTFTDAAALAASLSSLQGGPRSSSRRGAHAQELFSFDHLYAPQSAQHASPNTTDPTLPTAILYAPLGSTCAEEMHAALSAAAERAAEEGGSQLAYAWRPLLAPGCPAKCAGMGVSERLVLPGYGTELAIKNMEYNARDDSSKEEKGDRGGGVGGGEGDEAPDEVGGFLFPALLERKPHLRQELLTFRDHLLAAASREQVLKVWDLKDLGLQACQRITSSASDPLHLARELSHGFPTLVEALSRVAVLPELRSAVEGFNRLLPPSSPVLLVNGLSYETQEFNLFQFADTLRSEVRVWEELRTAGLPPSAARAALLLRAKASASQQAVGEFRLDLQSDDFISWVNNLESDSRYSRWPSSLDSLLMPMFPGRLPTVGRNVFNAILAFDPCSQSGLDAGAAVAQLHAQGWPLRFGLMPVSRKAVGRLRGGSSPSPPAQSRSSPGGGSSPPPPDAFARLLALVHVSFGGEACGTFLAAVREAVPANLEGWAGVATKDGMFQDTLWKMKIPCLLQARKVFLAQWGSWGAAASAASSKAAAAAALPPETALAAALEGQEGLGREARDFVEGVAELAVSKGVADLATGGGVVVFNGVVQEVEEGEWGQAIVQGVQSQMPVVQEDVYLGKLEDGVDDVYAAVLQLHGALPRYNPRVFPTSERSPRHIRMSGEGGEEGHQAPQMALTGATFCRECLAKLPLRYFSSPAGDEGAAVRPSPPGVTHWVVVDLNSAEGCQLASAALQHRSPSSRMGLLVNAADVEALSPAESAVLAVASGLVEADASKVEAWVEDLCMGGFPLGLMSHAELAEGLQQEGLEGVLAVLPTLGSALTAAAQQHVGLIRFGLQLGSNAVVTNGRIITVSPSEPFSLPDFQLAEQFALRFQMSAEAVQLAVQAAPGEVADVAMVVSSVLAAHQPDEVDPSSSKLVKALAKWRGRPNFIAASPQQPQPATSSLSTSNGGEEAAAEGVPPLLVQAVFDPLSKAAQQLTPVLLFLRDHLGAEIEVVLNPQRDLTDLPLKSFYKYALPTLLEEGPPEPAAAVFTALPPHKTLTLGMDVPEPWLVEPVQARYDLDNLRLEELGAERAVTAEFELEALMLTGSCLDLAALHQRMRAQIHPRGVQLQLGTPSHPALVDTLVMSNLGYFQLKAAPGVWQLQLAPGRSQELYRIASSTGGSSGAGGRGLRGGGVAAAAPSPTHVPVALTSFEGKHMYLFLRKDPLKMEQDVLDPGPESHEESSLWSKLGGWGKGREDAGKGLKLREGDDDTVHVFTVASGHMYERLQKIMILSAVKRTSARIKFWFIKNYMSPQMKAFVPHMAKQYGFDYEFVTYKWPSWLHKQSEKQRIIWAYKILFLDVLFPLGLKKVIFCDSDQVIRADLKELWTMDLHGAPYGYAPLCDGNTDMDGFRFWRQGFWRDHLQGRPYHISALYVVDLARFRQMAAGDRLRVMYDGLSKDPNSLANLDQDLPNYAQHSVPIFSLPTEWLWCETWCGNATKPQARTIDLCNNPLTKEPKLASARRIIKEWPDLNREAEEFTHLVEGMLAGELPEGAPLERHYFQTRLAPMVEGSVGSNEVGRGGDAKDGRPAHDVSEL